MTEGLKVIGRRGCNGGGGGQRRRWRHCGGVDADGVNGVVFLPGEIWSCAILLDRILQYA